MRRNLILTFLILAECVLVLLMLSPGFDQSTAQIAAKAQWLQSSTPENREACVTLLRADNARRVTILGLALTNMIAIVIYAFMRPARNTRRA
jgi:hypothetical protein